jgi:dihydrofolate reductase
MNIVVAACKNRGIGFQNNLPWKLKKELKYFRLLTKGLGNNAVVMGKNTCLSLPGALPKRENFVLSSTLSQTDNDFNIIKNIELLKKENYNTVWLIGGAQVYESMINNDMINTIYYTDIDEEFECDTFFPEIPNEFQEVFKSNNFEENGVKYNMKVFVNLRRFIGNGWRKRYANGQKEYINNVENSINKATAALHYTKLTLGD